MFLFNKYLLSSCHELGPGPGNGDTAGNKLSVTAALMVWGLIQCHGAALPVEDSDNERQK